MKAELVDEDLVLRLAAANVGRLGYTYTHHSPYPPHNREVFRAANQLGFTINLSANNLEEADRYADLECAPVVVTVPKDHPKVSYTEAGRKVVVCPAQTMDDMSCDRCAHKMCANPSRTIIVGFRAHGVKAKALSIRLKVTS